MAACANCGYANTPVGKRSCYRCGRPLEADSSTSIAGPQVARPSWNAAQPVNTWSQAASYQPAVAGSLVYAKSSLDQRELQMLESEMRGRGKNLTTAYLLWFFLGLLFVHRFYLKRGGGVFLAATLISIFLCVVLIGFIFLFILGIIWLADAFRMSGFVQEYNGTLEGQIITEILAARAGGMRMPYGAGYAAQPAPYAPASYAPAYAPPMGPPAWTPTHRVPSGGMATWDAPDGSRPPVSQLPGDVELVVEGSAGDWSQVRTANGWRGWVDGRLLTPRQA